MRSYDRMNPVCKHDHKNYRYEQGNYSNDHQATLFHPGRVCSPYQNVILYRRAPIQYLLMIIYSRPLIQQLRIYSSNIAPNHKWLRQDSLSIIHVRKALLKELNLYSDILFTLEETWRKEFSYNAVFLIGHRKK